MAGRFNGVKVFSATMFADRDRLGDKASHGSRPTRNTGFAMWLSASRVTPHSTASRSRCQSAVLPKPTGCESGIVQGFDARNRDDASVHVGRRSVYGQVVCFGN